MMINLFRVTGKGCERSLESLRVQLPCVPPDSVIISCLIIYQIRVMCIHITRRPTPRPPAQGQPHRRELKPVRAPGRPPARGGPTLYDASMLPCIVGPPP